MSIEISKPFVSYVVQEQTRTDDADVVFLLPLEIEDTNKPDEWRRGPWKYSDVR